MELTQIIITRRVRGTTAITRYQISPVFPAWRLTVIGSVLWYVPQQNQEHNKIYPFQ